MWRFLKEKIDAISPEALIKEGMFRIERLSERFETVPYLLHPKLIPNGKRL